mmetsp:Transcript_24155/g.52498  ORF Transcript_24155/g.52498 Transcript_24155/m.52498 type:complete len:84 (+) Transcript_24155:318-569(+)
MAERNIVLIAPCYRYQTLQIRSAVRLPFKHDVVQTYLRNQQEQSAMKKGRNPSSLGGSNHCGLNTQPKQNWRTTFWALDLAYS